MSSTKIKATRKRVKIVYPTEEELKEWGMTFQQWKAKRKYALEKARRQTPEGKARLSQQVKVRNLLKNAVLDSFQTDQEKKIGKKLGKKELATLVISTLGRSQKI